MSLIMESLGMYSLALSENNLFIVFDKIAFVKCILPGGGVLGPY